MKLLIVYLLLVFFPYVCFSESTSDVNDTEHPIDKRLAVALEIPENQTTTGMIACINKATREWQEEIYHNFNKLLLRLDGNITLKDAQKKWEELKITEFNVINEVYGRKEGTMWRIMLADRKMRFIRERALYLDALYQDLLFE